MFIRNIRKTDYEEIDKLLLQIHQVDVVLCLCWNAAGWHT